MSERSIVDSTAPVDQSVVPFNQERNILTIIFLPFSRQAVLIYGDRTTRINFDKSDLHAEMVLPVAISTRLRSFHLENEL